MQAMAIGLPIVATAVGAIAELVVDGQTGRLVPPRSPEILGERIRGLIDENELRHS
jgi:D-inositol-3-phosphate glycosyltransferase